MYGANKPLPEPAYKARSAPTHAPRRKKAGQQPYFVVHGDTSGSYSYNSYYFNMIYIIPVSPIKVKPFLTGRDLTSPHPCGILIP